MGRKLYTFRKTRLKQGLFGRYMPVEYIHFSGTQHIVIPSNADLNSKIRVRFRNAEVSGTNMVLFGASGTTGDNKSAFFMAHNSAKTAWYANFDTVTRTVVENPTIDDQWHTTVLSKDGWYTDDVLNATWSNPSAFDGGYIGIGARLIASTSTASNAKFIGDMSLVEYWHNGELQAQLIAVKDTVDNVYGMWDRLNNKFYGNAGTGSFTAGSLIQPIAYTPNNGMQYWKKTQCAHHEQSGCWYSGSNDIEVSGTQVKGYNFYGSNYFSFDQHYDEDFSRDWKPNHKYWLTFKFISCSRDLEYVDAAFRLLNAWDDVVWNSGFVFLGSKYDRIITIPSTFEPAEPLMYDIIFNPPSGGAWNSNDFITISDVMVLDLTEDFGEGNEPTTVAECEAHYGSNYVPYGSKNYLPVRVGSTVKMLDLESWTLATKTETFTPGADLPPEQDPVNYVIKKNNKLYLVGINGATHYTFQCPLGGSVLQVSDGATTTTVGADDVGDFPEFTVYAFEHPLLPITIWMLKGKTGCTGTVTNSDGDTYDITEMTDMEVGLGAYGARIDASADLSI